MGWEGGREWTTWGANCARWTFRSDVTWKTNMGIHRIDLFSSPEPKAPGELIV